jgi:hypothetical protein
MLETTSLDPLLKHKNQHIPGLAHHRAQPILPGIIIRYVKNSLLIGNKHFIIKLAYIF